MRINSIHNFLKCVFVYYKRYISIELTFLKELMLIKQVSQKSVIIATIGIFEIKRLSFSQITGINAMIF